MAEHRRKRRSGADDLLPSGYAERRAAARRPEPDGSSSSDDATLTSSPGRHAEVAAVRGRHYAEPAPGAVAADDPDVVYADDPRAGVAYANDPNVVYADDPHAGVVYADDPHAGVVYADGPNVAYADDPHAGVVYPDDPEVVYAEPRYADQGAGYADHAYADGHDPQAALAPGYGVAQDYDDPYHEDDYGDDGEYDEYDEYDDYDDDEHPARSRRRRHPVLAGFLVVVALLALLAGAGVLWASRQISPGGRPGRDVAVVIPKGSGTAEIGSILAKAGVIHSSTLFRYYVKLEGSVPMYAGTYHLATNQSYGNAINALSQPPPVVTEKLVIPEGFTLHEIAAAVAQLPGMHYSAASFLALSSKGQVRSPYEPAGVDNLEGLVFPATYPVQQGETEASIMEALVTKFDQVATQVNLKQRAAAMHMSPYQVITVASIVEGEVKYNGQMADAASVLYNRLASNMTLGADSTLIYALRQKNPNLNVNSVNFEQPSPYNTRLNKGLPPTPINSPSLPALQAAASPPKTNLLYFVEVKADGQLGFASTSNGFAQLNAECQAAKLC